MIIAFDYNVFAFEVVDASTPGKYRYRATVPLATDAGEFVQLRYSAAGKVEGRVVSNVFDCGEEGYFSHLVVETRDLGGLLAAEATANLLRAA